MEVEQHNGGGSGSSTSSQDIFTALYDFAGQDSSQLSFKKGEKVIYCVKCVMNSNVLYECDLQVDYCTAN